MAFRISGLPIERFEHMLVLDDDDALARVGAVRLTVDEPHAYPCRVTLQDAVPGEQVLLSVRAYDARDWIVAAEVTPGTELEPLIERLFADPRIAYLHLHNARPGCYAARVDRT
jgi:hypothetical protein